jgi:hypothetical protein
LRAAHKVFVPTNCVLFNRMIFKWLYNKGPTWFISKNLQKLLIWTFVALWWVPYLFSINIAVYLLFVGDLNLTLRIIYVWFKKQLLLVSNIKSYQVHLFIMCFQLVFHIAHPCLCPKHSWRSSSMVLFFVVGSWSKDILVTINNYMIKINITLLAW